jgi:hypothetical protein
LTIWVGRSALSHVLTLISVALTAFFIWVIVARTEFWRPSRLPFTIYFLGCAVYCQYLRAAAVWRSLPDKSQEITEIFR